MENLVQTWAAHDLKWRCGLGDAASHNEARDQMVARLALIRPRPIRHGGDIGCQQIPSGPIQDEAAISVLHNGTERCRCRRRLAVKYSPPDHCVIEESRNWRAQRNQ